MSRVQRKTKGLTDTDSRFVSEYLVDLCQWKAMMRAHGSTDPQEKNWRQLGYQAMAKPQVRAAVEVALAEQFKKLDATALDVKREIARMAMFDPAHVTGVTCPEDIALLPEDVRRAIVGWSWDRNGNFTVKLAKESALEMLGRHHGLFKDRVEHSGPGGGPIPVTPATLSDEQLAAIAARALAAPKKGGKANAAQS